jgi:hypothetical protein
MKGVYKKFLNRVTGTVIFLEDETVESLGEVANSLLKRLDEVLYFYADGKYVEIPMPKRMDVEVIEVKGVAPEEEVREEEPAELQVNEEVEVKVKTNNKNKRKNEG